MPSFTLSVELIQRFMSTGDNEEGSSPDKGGNVMPTGRVVGILQRNWRDYVCAFAQNTEVRPTDTPIQLIYWHKTQYKYKDSI